MREAGLDMSGSDVPIARVHEASRPAVIALGCFLREQCGSFKAAFNVLDARSRGSLDTDDFEGGLRNLGYSGDYAGVFQEMENGGKGLVMLRDFITYFASKPERLERSATSPIPIRDSPIPILNCSDGYYDGCKQVVQAKLDTRCQDTRASQQEQKDRQDIFVQALAEKATKPEVLALVHDEIEKAITALHRRLQSDVINLCSSEFEVLSQKLLNSCVSVPQAVSEVSSNTTKKAMNQKCSGDLPCSEGTLEIRDAIAALERKLNTSVETLHRTIRLHEQKHELLAERVMDGLDTLWNSLDNKEDHNSGKIVEVQCSMPRSLVEVTDPHRFDVHALRGKVADDIKTEEASHSVRFDRLEQEDTYGWSLQRQYSAPLASASQSPQSLNTDGQGVSLLRQYSAPQSMNPASISASANAVPLLNLHSLSQKRARSQSPAPEVQRVQTQSLQPTEMRVRSLSLNRIRSPSPTLPIKLSVQQLPIGTNSSPPTTNRTQPNTTRPPPPSPGQSSWRNTWHGGSISSNTMQSSHHVIGPPQRLLSGSVTSSTRGSTTPSRGSVGPVDVGKAGHKAPRPSPWKACEDAYLPERSVTQFRGRAVASATNVPARVQHDSSGFFMLL
jgi:hypothetical protein